jgi:hypothetical protein
MQTYRVNLAFEVLTRDYDPTRFARVAAKFADILPRGSQTLRAQSGTEDGTASVSAKVRDESPAQALRDVTRALELAAAGENVGLDALGPDATRPGRAPIRLTVVQLIAAASWVKLNLSATAPSASMTQQTWTSDAQSIPAITPQATAALLSSLRKVRPMQALVLVAHCKALEAHGPIASHSAGPPGPAALLLALEGRASANTLRARRRPRLCYKRRPR